MERKREPLMQYCPNCVNAVNTRISGNGNIHCDQCDCVITNLYAMHRSVSPLLYRYRMCPVSTEIYRFAFDEGDEQEVWCFSCRAPHKFKDMLEC